MRNSNSSNQPNRQNKNRSRSGKNNDQGGTRQRSQSNTRNKQATEMWMDSKTMTSHIPQNSRPNNAQGNGNGRHKNRNNNGPNKNRSQNNRQDAQGQRPRQDRAAAPRAQAPERGDSTTAGSTAAGSTAASAPSGKLVSGIEPFELFCAYHLGITRDKGYKPSNINEVARRFNADPATIKQALQEYNMDPGSLLDRDFDMALAQLDIQVAPEGVDRKELAKNIYEDFQNAPHIKRDWKKLLEEDRKENQKVFRD
ncbi:hypothetical protein [Nitrospina watsonii]|uniref:Uncharacterized protein n=1 Tax=Nitrospina watsonii TaxID=1323948 RepID=A0ABM9HB04_9BACT|nr:hypothetical protein [Nitrospina watsonii]CAI2717368.1 conserved protein of unknown function [Nitrospina watsonii]